MFSSGQLIFALLFSIAFVITMIFVYRKDSQMHAKNYKGVKWVFVAFVTFLILLLIIKYLLKN
jgi:mannose/fructose/N-acetylgalactosamine-specific phosphotransferase system component IIC